MEEVMKGHTRGPWTIWHHPNHHFGCEIQAPDGTIAQQATPADAQLIAAAPELLSATKALLEAINRNHNHEVQGDYCIADAYGLDDEVAEATEAIAKAEAS